MAASPVPFARVFLIGLMGSGKTTVGRRLAQATGWPYLDNDDLVREATGQTGLEIVAASGEDVLHAAEMAAFERAVTAAAPVIIGLAGWLVTLPDVQARISVDGFVVWLRARPETLLERGAGRRDRRPEAGSFDWIARTAESRREAFEAAADLVIDVDTTRPRVAVERILEAIGPR